MSNLNSVMYNIHYDTLKYDIRATEQETEAKVSNIERRT